jgi:cytidine deaminase
MTQNPESIEILDPLKELSHDFQHLVHAAIKARHRAHVPYSRFPVGAAVLSQNGSIHLGCNVENSSFGATTCAERVALYSAIARGETNFIALALIADTDQPLSPCGICRQVMLELAPSLEVIMANLRGEIIKTTIQDLLPTPFKFIPLASAFHAH